MQTQTKQLKSKLVDINNWIKDHNSPLTKAFMNKGQVFGFTSYYIVENELNLTQTIINKVELLVDSEGKTYKTFTTRDVAPAFTKGTGRNKHGINFKQELMNLCDYVVILEHPKNGKCVLTLFRTVDLILDDKGFIQ